MIEKASVAKFGAWTAVSRLGWYRFLPHDSSESHDDWYWAAILWNTWKTDETRECSNRLTNSATSFDGSLTRWPKSLIILLTSSWKNVVFLSNGISVWSGSGSRTDWWREVDSLKAEIFYWAYSEIHEGGLAIAEHLHLNSLKLSHKLALDLVQGQFWYLQFCIRCS